MEVDKAYQIAKDVTPHPFSCFNATPRHWPWEYTPTLYILASRDNMMTYHHQLEMVKQMKGVETITLKSSHSPHLSMPENVVSAIEKAEWLGRTRMKRMPESQGCEEMLNGNGPSGLNREDQLKETWLVG